MKQQAALRIAIRQLSTSRIPLGPLLISALQPIRSLVPSDAASLCLLGADGAVRDFFADWLPDASEIRCHINAIATTIRLLVQPPWPSGVDVLRGCCATDANCRFTLRCTLGNLTEGGLILTLYRREASGAYSDGDELEMRELLRFLAAGLQRTSRTPLPDSHTRPRQSAILLCDEAGEVANATAQGRGLMAMWFGVPHDDSTIESMSSQATVLQSLWQAGRQPDTAHCREELLKETFWGRLSLRRLSLLDRTADRPLLAVQVTWNRPLHTHLISSIGQLGLSPQQAEIALAIALGETTSEIASALSISQNTVGYHVKRLYAKLNVHDRAELISLLDSPPTTKLAA